jgi:spore coat polysaccharide biosynthesis protein SpsF (cytidylyltransferase family)/spore coat polysaccharide biosynthesis predicted glycosyltransferase SpsG
MAGKVIAVIGARLNSSRLPAKQLLPLVGKPVIARLVDRLRTIEALDEIIIATTDDPMNQRLVDWAESYGVKSCAWNGDENDVMGRVDAVVQKQNADIIVYVCGDSPLVEPATIAALIRASQSMQSGGIAKLEPNPDGLKYIHEGFDVFDRVFWNMMIEAVDEPFEREHVGAVYHHRAKVTPTEIAMIPENPIFASVGHRLSVDTPKDYQFMTRLYTEWYAQNPANSIVDLKWVVEQLKIDPTFAEINAHVHQKRVEETGLKVAILCEAGPTIGLGHLTRACVAAGSLQEHLGAGVELLVRGPQTDFTELGLLRHRWVNQFSGHAIDADIILSDVKSVDQDVIKTIEKSGASLTVGIDVSPECCDVFDMIWMPSFHIDKARYTANSNTHVRYGLDCFLLRTVNARQSHQHRGSSDNLADHQPEKKSVIVLTGGADPKRLSNHLPDKVLNILPNDVAIDWVQGPYASAPVVSKKDDRFSVLVAPENLHEKLADYDVALCVFGVTYFECLKAGVPTIVFDPIGASQPEEWQLVKNTFSGYTAENAEEALNLLAQFINQPCEYAFSDVQRQLQEGPHNLAKAIQSAYDAVKEGKNAAA